MVTLVDLKRANNVGVSHSIFLLTFVGILLSRIKVPTVEIKKAIEILDEKTLSLDNSRALMRLVPSDDEIEMLKKYQGDKEKLGMTEQFFMEVKEKIFLSYY